ncbi:MAG TPA: hypothetical protein VHZ03_52925 [Trebonia sp.]|jgi:hypothetical protein|nr:hypothetical protein [Trebonia sp.]
MQWIQHPSDPGVHYTSDDSYDVLEGDEGFLLRKNLGDDDCPDWQPCGHSQLWKPRRPAAE